MRKREERERESKEERKEKREEEKGYPVRGIWKLLTGTLGRSPGFYLSFNCSFLRYPRKTGERDCLILNKSIKSGTKSVMQEEHFWTRLLEKLLIAAGLFK